MKNRKLRKAKIEKETNGIKIEINIRTRIATKKSIGIKTRIERKTNIGRKTKTVINITPPVVIRYVVGF